MAMTTPMLNLFISPPNDVRMGVTLSQQSSSYRAGAFRASFRSAIIDCNCYAYDDEIHSRDRAAGPGCDAGFRSRADNQHSVVAAEPLQPQSVAAAGTASGRDLRSEGNLAGPPCHARPQP